jgi:hypothetical protein
MNTINMPGFTADTSLYKTSGHYQTDRQAINSLEQKTSSIYPSMMRQELLSNGIDCGNCVGGECATLNCFENWTHSGAPSGGPYQGPSRGERWSYQPCTWKPFCEDGCKDDFTSCKDNCLGRAKLSGPFFLPKFDFDVCVNGCIRSGEKCVNECDECL